MLVVWICLCQVFATLHAGACAPPGLIYSTEACAALVRVYTTVQVQGAELYLNVPKQ